MTFDGLQKDFHRDHYLDYLGYLFCYYVKFSASLCYDHTQNMFSFSTTKSDLFLICGYCHVRLLMFA